jgi:hypothetical protein
LVAKPLEGASGGFFHNFGNDLLCIPIFLPVYLWVYRRVGIRNHDGKPTLFELLSHLVIWSWFFEWAAPHIGGQFAWTVGDAGDVAAYSVGALVAGFAWGTFRMPRTLLKRPNPEPIPPSRLPATKVANP